VWSAADIANGFMIFPNLIGLLGLSGAAVTLVRDYFKPTWFLIRKFYLL
jgi:Na+/alanine symporter